MQNKKEIGKSEEKQNKRETKSSSDKLAIIRIRGEVGVKKKIKDTLNTLRLYKKNWCVLVNKDPSFVGMTKIIKDYAAYGEVTDEVVELLMKKAKKDKKGKLKPFRLSPPRGGFERKGIKVSFKSGGALGYRGEKINDLIKRML